MVTDMVASYLGSAEGLVNDRAGVPFLLVQLRDEEILLVYLL